MGLILAIIITVVFSACPAIAEPQKEIVVAESPSGMVCVMKMKDAFRPGHSCLRRLVVSTKDQYGRKAEYIAGEAYKTFPDGKRMVLVMLEPKDVKGTTYLFSEQENRLGYWVYFPYIKRVRELTGIQAYDSLFGTEFTISDIGLIPVPAECELVEVTTYAGVKAYKVQEKVSGGGYYSRIITWISTDSFLPLRRDYYDTAGRLWKTTFFQEVTAINKIPMPLLIQMKDLQSGYTTDLDISNVVLDATVPDEFFDPTQLSKVADFPLWKDYTSQPTHGK
jgi:hypothetical protein